MNDSVDAALVTLSLVVILAGLVGSYSSYRLLREAQEDLAVVLRLAPDRATLRLIGEGHIRSERNRLWTQVCFVVSGALGLVGSFYDLSDLARVLLRIMLLAGIVLVNANSLLSAKTRRDALEAIRRETPRASPPGSLRADLADDAP